jgi:hypothetical protein
VGSFGTVQGSFLWVSLSRVMPQIVVRRPRRAPEFSGDLSKDVVGSAVCSCRSAAVCGSACVVYVFLCTEQILQLCYAV